MVPRLRSECVSTSMRAAATTRAHSAMKTKFQIASTGPLLTLLKPANQSFTLGANINQQALLKCYYKRLFRLRHLILDAPYEQETYKRLIRRRVQFVDFNKRRSAITKIYEPLSHQQLIERLENTYTFLFNATCNVADDPPAIYLYEDMKETQAPRLETSILSTILEMDRQYPEELLFDFNFDWFHRAEEVERELSSGTLGAKQGKSLAKSKKLDLIGFADYERTLMALNETFKFCL